MTLGSESEPHPSVRSQNKVLLAIAGLLLVIPVVALMWVGSYAKEDPKIWGFPFFFWYQFVWVFVTSALTYTSYRLILAARHQSVDEDKHEGDR